MGGMLGVLYLTMLYMGGMLGVIYPVLPMVEAQRGAFYPLLPMVEGQRGAFYPLLMLRFEGQRGAYYSLFFGRIGRNLCALCLPFLLFGDYFRLIPALFPPTSQKNPVGKTETG